MACTVSTNGVIDHCGVSSFDLLGQAVHTDFSVGHGMNVVLQNDLARRVSEAHRGEPATISQGPALLTGIDAPMSQ